MDNQIYQKIGNHLWGCRAKKGWTQEFVARQLGVTIRTISRVENGGGISKPLLIKMCGLYRIPLSDVYMKEPPVKKSSFAVKVEVIPDEVAIRLMQSSSFVEDIQKESILRFNDVVQKNTQMLRDEIEEVLPEIISKKQVYSLSDVISCCMAINQKTLDNIRKIAVS